MNAIELEQSDLTKLVNTVASIAPILKAEGAVFVDADSPLGKHIMALWAKLEGTRQ
jgi:hypothetical protein